MFEYIFTCDHCHKDVRVQLDHDAPTGWFAVQQFGEQGQILRRSHFCSAKCLVTALVPPEVQDFIIAFERRRASQDPSS